MRTMRIILMALVFVHICCGGGGKSKQSYPDLVEAGWSAFADGDYNAAFSLYSDAIDADPEQAAAYAGLGWALMKLDNIAQANGTFNTGSTKTNPPADLFAGWSFVLNAQKSYANSNIRIDQTLTMDFNWTLAGAPTLNLNKNDLRVLKAENHFILGEFSQSLAEVKILNPSFSLSVIATDSDKAALVAEIQRLKGVS